MGSHQSRLDPSQKRDKSLDVIKGIGCIMMIVPHAWMSHWGERIDLAILSYFGGLAPIVFFSIAGITAVFQSQKTSLKVLFLYYTSLAILGFSYNAIWGQVLVCDILQTIAMGSIVVIIIEKKFNPSALVYLILAIIAYLIHYIVHFQFSLNFIFPFWPFIFMNATNIFGTDQFTPFPIIPWIFTFLIGCFTYRINFKAHLIISIGLGICFTLHLIDSFKQYQTSDFSSVLDKYQVSPGYLLFALTVLFLIFYLVNILKKINLNLKVIIYLGKNSLLFLYVNLLVINLTVVMTNTLSSKIVIDPYLFISFVFVLSYLGMKGIQYCNHFVDHYFENPVTWLILGVAIFMIPLVSNNINFVKYSENFLGILFACNYHKISSLIKSYYPETGYP